VACLLSLCCACSVSRTFAAGRDRSARFAAGEKAKATLAAAWLNCGGVRTEGLTCSGVPCDPAKGTEGERMVACAAAVTAMDAALVVDYLRYKPVFSKKLFKKILL